MPSQNEITCLTRVAPIRFCVSAALTGTRGRPECSIVVEQNGRPSNAFPALDGTEIRRQDLRALESLYFKRSDSMN